MSNLDVSSSESHFSVFSDLSSSDSDESELRGSRLRSSVHKVKKNCDNSVKRSSGRPTQKSSDQPNQKSSDTGNRTAKNSFKNLGKKSVHS